MQSPDNMQVVVIPSGQVAYVPTSAYPYLKAKGSLVLGILQIILGCLCVLLQIASMILNTGFSIIVLGFLGGIPFIVAGVFGILASKKKSRCTVLTLMVMSIISAALAGCIIATYGFIIAVTGSDDDDNVVSSHAVNIPILVLAFVEMIVAIIQAAFCCGAVCCSSIPTTTVTYMNQHKASLQVSSSVKD